MKYKQSVAAFLRWAGLMQLSDRLRFLWLRSRNHKMNGKFRLKYPEVVLPPDYILYESFQLDYERYYLNGRKTAEWLTERIEKHRDLKGARILDWGCGPARVLRHLPGLIEGGDFYGTDYNRKTIAWCSASFNEIFFHTNDLMPGLIYESQMFDLVYGISIFTHLSAEGHDAWLQELIRIIKPGGILLITLHGQAFRKKLTSQEIRTFDSGQLVIRGHVNEGHRTFAAFHPERWVRSWAESLTILDYFPGKDGEQDVWIFEKSERQ